MTETQNSDELLPCPFCGTTKEWFSQINGINRCAECGCTCMVEFWNTRPSPATVSSDADGETVGTKDFEGWRRQQDNSMLRAETAWQTIERAFYAGQKSNTADWQKVRDLAENIILKEDVRNSAIRLLEIANAKLGGRDE